MHKFTLLTLHFYSHIGINVLGINQKEIDFIMRIMLIVISFFLLSACHKSEFTLKHSLVYCTESDPKSFNPQLADDYATLDATTHQLYNRLVKRNPITQKIIPDLATHWIENKKKNSITFFLRKNIAFHHTAYFYPTRNFNADDVIFSFNRMLSAKNPFHATSPLSDNYFFNHPFNNSIKQIIKINDYVITFVLKGKVQYFLDDLTENYNIILSKQYAQQLLAQGETQKIDYLPIGTGPYKFKNFSNDNLIRYQANTQYWQGKPSIDTLIYSITHQSIKRYAKFLSGQCDIITYPSPIQIKKISLNKNYTISSHVTSDVILLAFNTKHGALKNNNVRRILSHMINKKQILRSIFFDTTKATNSILSTHSWAFNPDLNHDNYRSKIPKKDLVLLYHNLSKPLIIVSPKKGAEFDPLFKKTAEIIKHDLTLIGVRSEIHILSSVALHNSLSTGNYDLLLMKLNGNNAHPIAMFKPLLSCDSNTAEGNAANWCQPNTQALLNGIINSSTFSQKKQKFDQLQMIIQTEHLYLPIAHIFRFHAMHNNISGIILNQTTGIDFFNAKIQGTR